MDKIVLGLIILGIVGVIVVVPSFLGAKAEISTSQQCDVVIPAYGVVQCSSTGAFENPSAVRYGDGTKYIAFAIDCKEECSVRSDLIKPVTCSGSSLTDDPRVKVDVNGITQLPVTRYRNMGSFLYKLYKGQSAVVVQTCTGLFGDYAPNSGTGAVNYDSLKIMLYEGVAGTLPTKPIPGTEGCTLNQVSTDVRSKYTLQTPTNTILDPTTQQNVVKPSSTYTSLSQAPANWHLTENYVYLDHYTKTYGISPIFFSGANGYVYCGGTVGSRKVLDMVRTVDPIGGQCVVYPSGIAKTVECCSDVDCSFKGTGYVCNPESWKCDNRKPCNSDLECPQSTQCVNRQSDTWKCDLNQPYSSSYRGTCTKQTVAYVQCPNECTADQYWNSQTTRCEARSVLEECGSGNCCTSGGQFKPQSCSFGQACCSVQGSAYKGVCKSSCDPPKEKCTVDTDCNDLDPQTKDTCVTGLLGNDCKHEKYCSEGQIYNTVSGKCEIVEQPIDPYMVLAIIGLLGIVGAGIFMARRR